MTQPRRRLPVAQINIVVMTAIVYALYFGIAHNDASIVPTSSSDWGGFLSSIVPTAAAFGLCGLVFRIFICIRYASLAGIIPFKRYLVRYLCGIAYAACWLGFLVVSSNYLSSVASAPFARLVLLAGITAAALALFVGLTPFGRRQYAEAVALLAGLRQREVR